MSEEGMSFARRYRPNTIRGYVGNEKIVSTLQKIITSGNRVQSVLIVGPTGCGKTTIARIIVKEYLCEKPSGGTSCGQCETCQTVDEYILSGNEEYLSDVTEVDITDKSGKSHIDDVLETLDYPSLTGGWKVYLFDEIHMASKQAQNRLLKTLEEPPEKVLFIFCTTDPQMMIETLKNRCTLKLTVKKPSLGELAGMLKVVCQHEGVRWDSEGLRTVSTKADFIIRDALNLLEQVIGSKGEVTGKAVSEEFDQVSDELIHRFVKAYLNHDYVSYLAVMSLIRGKGGFSQFIKGLSQYVVRGVYILNGIAMEGVSPHEVEEYNKLFKKFTPQEITTLIREVQSIKQETSNIEISILNMVYRANEVKEASKEGETQSKSVPIQEVKVRSEIKRLVADEVMESSKDSLTSLHEKATFNDLSSMFSMEKLD